MTDTYTLEYTERAPAADEPCVTFKTCGGHGTLPHQPLPFGRIGVKGHSEMEIGCDRCGQHLWTHVTKTVPVAPQPRICSNELIRALEDEIWLDANGYNG